MKIKISALIMFCFAPLFTACSLDGSFTPLTFGSADSPGDVVKITVDSESVDMIYVNNQESITFPFSPSVDTPADDQIATLTNRFFMSETQVTNTLFAKVLQWAFDNGKFSATVGAHNGLDSTTAKHGGQQILDLDDENIKINYSEESFTVESGFENHPAVCVTWYGAVMFCNWLTEMRDGTTTNLVYSGIDTDWVDTETVETATKNGYRLPSSEEWEYAARYIGTTIPTVERLASEYIAQSHNSGHAGLTAGYYWTPAAYATGANKDYTHQTETRTVAWYTGDTEMGGGDALMPAGQKAVNQLGLLDMSGNVWEWCFTLLGSDRVIRGGGWSDTESSMQVGYWGCNIPCLEDDDIGFRFVRSQYSSGFSIF